jgi:predicted TIM-barrel fold metal-dependent hydrolase
MTAVFDSHNHIFPPMASGGAFDEACLKETQYHVRFAGPGGFRRVGDNAPLTEPVMEGEDDGISWLPDLDFRVGEYGRVLFTYDGDDYYYHFIQASAADMSSKPEHVITQMDFAGVDRALIQHDHVYGRLDDYLGDAIQKYPDRLVALAQVDEWRGGHPDQLDRLRRQVEELGFSGLYFSTGGFFHVDFTMGVNDSSLEPLWELVADLGIPIHWYLTETRRPRVEVYLRELRDLAQWASAHPHIPSVLTHGLETLRIDMTNPRRFEIPPEIFDLVGRDGWHIELMLHKMLYDHEFPPYHPEAPKIVRTLIENLGVDKIVWGSDMPSCETVTTYSQSKVLYESQCEFLTQKQRDAILGGNLERLYPPRT